MEKGSAPRISVNTKKDKDKEIYTLAYYKRLETKDKDKILKSSRKNSLVHRVKNKNKD